MFWLTSSTNFIITRARRCGLNAAHPFCASTATATAASMSAAEPIGTCACTRPLFGSYTSAVRFDRPAVRWPSMKCGIRVVMNSPSAECKILAYPGKLRVPSAARAGQSHGPWLYGLTIVTYDVLVFSCDRGAFRPIALTIDTEVHRPYILLIRGRAELDVVEGIPDEYLETNGTQKMTPEQRVDWEADVRSLYNGIVRILV